jgi:hypothetical protein
MQTMFGLNFVETTVELRCEECNYDGVDIPTAFAKYRTLTTIR